MSRRAKKALFHPIQTLRIINRRYMRLLGRNQDPQIDYMQSWIYGSLPKRHLEVVLPEARHQSFQMVDGFSQIHNMSVTTFELCQILAIQKAIGATRVLEIGTFDGGTTVNLAANLPDQGEVATVDLPVEQADSTALRISGFNDNRSERRIVGARYKGTPFEGKIRQIFQDSAKLSREYFPNQFDLVFVDGCHDMKYVASDTELALSVLAPGGVILWHDYGMIRDVSDCLDELSTKLQLSALSGGRLVMYRKT